MPLTASPLPPEFSKGQPVLTHEPFATQFPIADAITRGLLLSLTYSAIVYTEIGNGGSDHCYPATAVPTTKRASRDLRRGYADMLAGHLLHFDTGVATADELVDAFAAAASIAASAVTSTNHTDATAKLRRLLTGIVVSRLVTTYSPEVARVVMTRGHVLLCSEHIFPEVVPAFAVYDEAVAFSNLCTRAASLLASAKVPTHVKRAVAADLAQFVAAQQALQPTLAPKPITHTPLRPVPENTR